MLLQGLIAPMDEAFRAGQLMMGSDVVRECAEAAPSWAGYPLNWALVVICAIALAFNIPNIYHIAPHLWKGLERWRWHFTIEASIQLARTRDYLAFFCIVPFALIADRFALFNSALLGAGAAGAESSTEMASDAAAGSALSPGLDFLANVPPEWRVLAVFGILAAYYLIRTIPYLILEGRAARHSVFHTARKAERSFFIVLTFILLAGVGLMTMFGAEDQAIRSFVLWATIIVYILFLFKKTQIVGSVCSPISTILYLCALEFLPAGLLIAACLFM